ncbi:MAG: transcription antitermination factor NusB [Acidaminococcaceae bacterium]|nr:transcription antitermination factor NusB [Acidaminococcaceae bacterium]
MIRRLAREIVLQSLFQLDFEGCDKTTALEAAIAEHTEKETEKSVPYAEELLNGIIANKKQIDEKIKATSIDWSLERLSATDRNILRLAIYEIFFAEPAVAAGVAINEAVEIAKGYGSEESPRFVNGVLGTLVR